MLITFVLLTLGLYILIKGSDLLVDGASAVAKKLNVAPMIIGLTIIAFGTSAPELVTSIAAARKGHYSIPISL